LKTVCSTFWELFYCDDRGVTQDDSYRKIQQDATVYQNLLFHIYVKLSMFRATHGPSSGA